MRTARSVPNFSTPLQPPGGMMIWVFILMEMKHAYCVWQATITLFVLMIVGAVSFSL